MRLTCPNCDAQYEVNEGVIPDEGRDVQCSNCGTTWFQESAATLLNAALPEDAAVDLSDLDAPSDLETAGEEDSEPTDPRPEEAPITPEASPEPADTPTPTATQKAEIADPQASASPVPKAPSPQEDRPDLRRRNLDDAMLNVLREEAEREARARKAEGSSLETQAELGLSDAREKPEPTTPVQSPEVPHPDQDLDEDELDGNLVSRSARRQLLPDIEEINSTLRATSERGDEAAARDAPETLRQRRSGFRRGFLTALLVMTLMLLPYILADSFVTRFPALEPAIVRYSAGIDSLRIWMDERIKSSTESMRDKPKSTN
jgi:predicted Zn finger-like uncharacterized protein